MIENAEQQEQLPTIFATGITKFLSKGKGTNYIALRPITLMNVVYSTWATYRSKEIAMRLERVLPNNLYGGRKGISPQLAELPSALNLEINKLSKDHVLGTSEDYNKCFDSLDAQLMCDIWEAMRVDHSIVGTIRRNYSHHSRFFSINGNALQDFETISLIQGCAFSLHMVNSLFAILSLRLSDKCPDVDVQFFVDDSKSKVKITNIEQMYIMKQERDKFNRLAGLVLNPSKCIAWGTSDKARKLALNFIPPAGKVVKYSIFRIYY